MGECRGCPVGDRGLLAGESCEGREGRFHFHGFGQAHVRGMLQARHGELLAPGGIMLCDNVLYRGLTAQHNAGELPKVSEKTAANAASMDAFLELVRADTAVNKVRSLMMQVRDGMLALQMPQVAAPPAISNKGYPVQA